MQRYVWASWVGGCACTGVVLTTGGRKITPSKKKLRATICSSPFGERRAAAAARHYGLVFGPRERKTEVTTPCTSFSFGSHAIAHAHVFCLTGLRCMPHVVIVHALSLPHPRSTACPLQCRMIYLACSVALCFLARLRASLRFTIRWPHTWHAKKQCACALCDPAQEVAPHPICRMSRDDIDIICMARVCALSSRP